LAPGRIMASDIASLGPWLAVAGVGALHGLNPATGWMLAAASGLHSRDRAQAWRALMPIAFGHTVSVVLVASVVALAVAMGLPIDRGVLQAFAGALFVVAAGAHLCRRTGARGTRATAARAGRTGRVGWVGWNQQGGLALGSFIMSTAHGAGLMLVPALIPICIGDGPARGITASGSLTLAFAAVCVHTAAMLAVTGAIAAGACRSFDALSRWLRKASG
jgi:hypothetical protein